MAKEYDISRTSGQCLTCQKALEPGDEFMAAVREGEEGLLREDHCLECWQKRPDAADGDHLAVWRARVPQPQEKRKLLVDDPLIANFFERLEDAETPAKISYRFVLALVLMRKKILVYEGMRKSPEGPDRWTMRFKGTDRTCEVIDPHMDEEKIAEVSQHLGEIMEGEL